MHLPSLEKLINELRKLPSIGFKNAQRIAFFFLENPDIVKNLSQAIDGLSKIKRCKICYMFTENEDGICDICRSEDRDKSTICVVEDYKSAIAIEQTNTYNGLYHVLLGHIDPTIHKQSKITIDKLIERVKKGNVKEVIIATNPNIEGDATANFIKRELENLVPKITRLARGMLIGTSLENTDPMTISKAILTREVF